MATEKQKRAFKEITENHRSVSAAMREVGYDESSATKPSNLTNSKGWKDLMEEYLPDTDLAKVHKEGLSAAKKVFKNNNESGEIEFVGEEPDFSVRHKYLDSAYKLKGSYAPEKSLNVNVEARVADEKALKLAEEYEERLKNDNSTEARTT